MTNTEPAGSKFNRHGGAPVLFAPNRRALDCTGVRMPEFRNFSTDAERAFGGIKLPPLIGDKINIRRAGCAMRVSQFCVSRRVGEFKIRLQILRGKNVGQRFAPNDTAFAERMFLVWIPSLSGSGAGPAEAGLNCPKVHPRVFSPARRISEIPRGWANVAGVGRPPSRRRAPDSRMRRKVCGVRSESSGGKTSTA